MSEPDVDRWKESVADQVEHVPLGDPETDCGLTRSDEVRQPPIHTPIIRTYAKRRHPEAADAESFMYARQPEALGASLVS